MKSELQWLPFFCICSATNQNKNTGRCRTTKDVRSDYRKWELWGMYYLGMMPTADKRLYCTTLREAFNSFALKCFKNIWQWFVCPTVHKSVKPFGFVTRQHVSTHFWFLYPSFYLCLCFFLPSQPLIQQSTEMSIWWHIIYNSWDCSRVFAQCQICYFTSKPMSAFFNAYSAWIS